ncbi:MAG: hypothetical protein EBZ77_12510 [Chitinophagia bacterium]|nr:hypothetical protein [Chitinophagia bacterium]
MRDFIHAYCGLSQRWANLLPMLSLEQQVIETWYINHRANLLLLGELTEEALGFSTAKRGGGSIGHQLAHLYNIRYWKLEKIDKALVADLTTITAEDVKTIAMLQECHTITAERMGNVLEIGLQQGAIKGFSRGVVPFMVAMVAHEAHHRGNILLTLKNGGFKLTDALKYTLWDWNKL